MPWRETPPESMHLCPSCQSPLLCMKHASQLPGGWLMLSAYCPDCGQNWDGPANMEQVCALAEATERGMAEMMLEAHRLGEDSSS